MVTPPLPDKKYSVIYADPPWDFKCGTGLLGNSHPRNYYPLVDTDDLCKIPVKDISDNHCLLFMWVISPMLDQAINVGKAWGFEFSTVGFIWDKQRLVMGYYTMSQCELCLIFKKGKIPQPRGKRNIRQFLSVKRGKHSEKPWEVRDRIADMFPHHDKIELFARQRFPGWDAWGNEV